MTYNIIIKLSFFLNLKNKIKLVKNRSAVWRKLKSTDFRIVKIINVMHQHKLFIRVPVNLG